MLLNYLLLIFIPGNEFKIKTSETKQNVIILVSVAYSKRQIKNLVINNYCVFSLFLINMGTEVAVSFSTLRAQLENEKSSLFKIDENIKKIVQTTVRFNDRLVITLNVILIDLCLC